MRRIAPALVALVVGLAAGYLLGSRGVASPAPDEIVVNFPVAGAPDDEHGNEPRSWHTLAVVPGALAEGERGLWFVKLRYGDRVTQYRCRPATP